MIQVKLNKYLAVLNQNTVINCFENGSLYKLSTLIDKIFNVLNNCSWTYQEERHSYGKPKSEYDSFTEILLLYLKKEKDVPINSKVFSEEGIEGEVLNTKSGEWMQGKVRAKVIFELEFIPHENNFDIYESPLDEIRRELEQSS